MANCYNFDHGVTSMLYSTMGVDVYVILDRELNWGGRDRGPVSSHLYYLPVLTD